MSVRVRLVTYFVVVHLAMAGVGGWLVWTSSPFWLLAVEAALVLSLAVGIVLIRRAVSYQALAADASRLVHDEAFTSRFLPVGEPDVDAMIALYNRMVDRLRDERVRLAEQHQFLAQVIAASPSGIVVLGFDDEVSSLNPAAARIARSRRRRRERPAHRRPGDAPRGRARTRSRPASRASSAPMARGACASAAARSSTVASREGST